MKRFHTSCFRQYLVLAHNPNLHFMKMLSPVDFHRRSLVRVTLAGRFLILSFLLFSVTDAFSQTRKLHEEKSGFVWYEVITADRKVGVESASGKTLLPAEFFDVCYVDFIFKELGYFKVKKDGFQAVYDKNGACIIPIDREYDYCCKLVQGFKVWYKVGAQRRKKLLYGACGTDGKEIIPPIHGSIDLKATKGQHYFSCSKKVGGQPTDTRELCKKAEVYKKYEKYWPKAEKIYRQAADNGSMEAMYELGHYYFFGTFKRMQFDGIESRPYGGANEARRDRNKGLDYLRQAAFLDNIPAQLELAIAYIDPKSPGHSYKQAYEMATKAYYCTNGYGRKYRRSASLLLSDMLKEGRGCERDLLSAYKLATGETLVKDENLQWIIDVIESASSVHHPLSLEEREALLWSHLKDKPLTLEERKRYGADLSGRALLSKGLELYEKNKTECEALFWIHRAARKGNPQACYILGLLHKNGDCGLKESMDDAKYWFKIARDKGSDEGRNVLALIEKQEAAEKDRREKERRARVAAAARREAAKRARRRTIWGGILQGIAQATVGTLNQMNGMAQANSYHAPSSIASRRNMPVAANSIAGGNMNYLLDPRYAIAQVQQQEMQEYRQFSQYNKKADGSNYSLNEWRALQGQAIQNLKDEGYDLIAEQREQMRRNRAEREIERQQDKEKWFARYGYDDGGASSSNATASSTSSRSSSGASVASSKTASSGNVSSKSTVDEKKLDANQQYKREPVASDDYRKIKTVTLYYREGSTAKVKMSQVELYQKGAYKYIKIGSTYYPRRSSNWSRFGNAIAYDHIQLYYND